MTIVTAQMSVSVDGFYAGPKHTDMQTWLEGPEAAGFFRVTRWAIDAARVIATLDVTHIRYKVNNRRLLVLDNRGRDEEPAVA
jgi:hypothetical protein